MVDFTTSFTLNLCNYNKKRKYFHFTPLSKFSGFELESSLSNMLYHKQSSATVFKRAKKRDAVSKSCNKRKRYTERGMERDRSFLALILILSCVWSLLNGSSSSSSKYSCAIATPMTEDCNVWACHVTASRVTPSPHTHDNDNKIKKALVSNYINIKYVRYDKHVQPWVLFYGGGALQL